MQSGKKKDLNRQVILDVAQRLSKKDGVGSLTVRKIATQLDVTPMAIYRHYSNKSDLLSAMLDAFISDADVLADSTLKWDEWLKQSSVNMFNALCEQPSWIPLLGQIELGASGVIVMESFLKVLKQAGFEDKVAVNTFFTVTQNIVGSACIRSTIATMVKPEGSGEEYLRLLGLKFKGLPDSQFSHTVELSGDIAKVVSNHSIDFFLDMLIAGLKKTGSE